MQLTWMKKIEICIIRPQESQESLRLVMVSATSVMKSVDLTRERDLGSLPQVIHTDT